jgi:non-ribosomal peptide synthetase component E (peptide arylation enzyme)
LPDDALRERTACVVVLADSSNGDAAQLHGEIERIMKKHNLPVDEIHVVDSIPMDPRHHSKVEYEALRTQLEGAAA